MATKNKLTTDQIVTVGRYMWEHRDDLAKMNKAQAFTKTIDATRLSVCRNTWEKLLKEMQIECRNYRSTVDSALTILRQELNLAPVVPQ